MTTQIQGPDSLVEGNLLPAPRAFGEANTLTLPHRPRQSRSQGGVVGLATGADEGVKVLHAGIMRVDATDLTVTF